MGSLGLQFSERFEDVIGWELTALADTSKPLRKGHLSR